MKIYCGSVLAVSGTSKSAILGWTSTDEAWAFREAYEKLGFDASFEAEWSPNKENEEQ